MATRVSDSSKHSGESSVLNNSSGSLVVVANPVERLARKRVIA